MNKTEKVDTENLSMKAACELLKKDFKYARVFVDKGDGWIGTWGDESWKTYRSVKAWLLFVEGNMAQRGFFSNPDFIEL